VLGGVALVTGLLVARRAQRQVQPGATPRRWLPKTPLSWTPRGRELMEVAAAAQEVELSPRRRAQSGERVPRRKPRAERLPEQDI